MKKRKKVTINLEKCLTFEAHIDTGDIFDERVKMLAIIKAKQDLLEFLKTWHIPRSKVCEPYLKRYDGFYWVKDLSIDRYVARVVVHPIVAKK